MVKLTKIYTRGGDSGQTSLGDGSRLAKHDLRISAYGTIDEANAVIGIVRLHTTDHKSGDIDALLGRIQNDLFDVGADLATPGETFNDENALRTTQPQIDRLEQEIDRLNADLGPLNSFILPGGSAASAYLHLARTVVRRAERLISEASGHVPLNPLALKYMNRLSDLLFVLGRKLNDNGTRDVLWVPGANR